jgi:hypothetical protein
MRHQLLEHALAELGLVVARALDVRDQPGE